MLRSLVADIGAVIYFSFDMDLMARDSEMLVDQTPIQWFPIFNNH